MSTPSSNEELVAEAGVILERGLRKAETYSHTEKLLDALADRVEALTAERDEIILAYRDKVIRLQDKLDTIWALCVMPTHFVGYAEAVIKTKTLLNIINGKEGD